MTEDLQVKKMVLKLLFYTYRICVNRFCWFERLGTGNFIGLFSQDVMLKDQRLSSVDRFAAASMARMI